MPQGFVSDDDHDAGHWRVAYLRSLAEGVPMADAAERYLNASAADQAMAEPASMSGGNARGHLI